MIRTSNNDKGKTVFADESAFLTEGERALVMAAMAAGFEDFTTPTPGDDDGRVAWRVRKWLCMRNGKPAAFLVAYQELNAHFEVIGPEIPLADSSLQKR